MSILPKCVYWDACYRKNPAHLAQFRHPPDDQPNPDQPQATPTPTIINDSTSTPITTGGLMDRVSQENQGLITQFITSKQVNQSMLKIGRQVHPDLSFESVIPMLQKFHHALLLTIPWSELENASLGSTPLLSWIHPILPGELAKHAFSDAHKANIRAQMANHLKEQLEHKQISGDSSGDAVGLQFPFFPSSSIRVRDQIEISTVLEYLTVEFLELIGTEARSHGCRRCTLAHLANVLLRDAELNELVVKLKCATEMGLTPTGDATAVPPNPNLVLDYFPHTQNKIRALLEKHAWFYKPEMVEEVFAHFVAGELTLGHLECNHLFIRPYAYLGQTGLGVFVAKDQYCFNPTDVDEDDWDSESLSNYALLSVAFDIEDAAGRCWPLVAEYRGEIDSDAPGYTNYGGVFDRLTGKKLGSIRCYDQDRGDLTLDSGIAEGYFAEFARHGFHTNSFRDYWKGYFRETHPSEKATPPTRKQTRQVSTEPPQLLQPNEPLLTADNERMLERRRWEITALCCAAMNLCGLVNLTAFSAYHPPTVVSKFARVILRQAFDSPEVTGALTPNFHMPHELIDLISEYATVDLPYLPLFAFTRDSPLIASELSPIGRLVEDVEQARQDRMDEDEDG